MSLRRLEESPSTESGQLSPGTPRWCVRILGTAMAALATVVAVSGTASAAPAPTQAVWGWGALAFSPSTGSVAYADDYPSLDEASRAATNKCGVQDCQALVEVADGCASLTQASNGALGWAYAASRSVADDTARRYTPGSHTHVIAWVCTTGHQ